jgi:hypothetical protein
MLKIKSPYPRDTNQYYIYFLNKILDIRLARMENNYNIAMLRIKDNEIHSIINANIIIFDKDKLDNIILTYRKDTILSKQMAIESVLDHINKFN